MTQASGDMANVRHTSYFIVESKTPCARCTRITSVFALALPAGYESLIANDDVPEEAGTWESPGIAAVLSYVDYLPESVIDRVRGVTAHYLFKANELSNGGLWINCCQHCGAVFDEEDLHGDLDSPFGPLAAQGLDAIQVHHVREPFEARVGGESHDIKPLQS